jgi:hypothetical protein
LPGIELGQVPENFLTSISRLPPLFRGL